MRALSVMVLFVWIVVLKANRLVAQIKLPAPFPQEIRPYAIAVGYHKTSSLIFPYSIISVDRGSASVMAQKAKGVDNILQLKAAKTGFVSTNLSVVTSDGKFYSFLVRYENDPKVVSMQLGETISAQFNKEHSTEHTLEMEAYAVKVQPARILKQVSRSGVEVTLSGIFFSDQHQWFRLEIFNDSPINFQPDQVRFFLRDRKKTKRTAIQETELYPVYTNVSEQIPHQSSDHMLLGFPSFFIPKEKYLVVQIGEQDNGRMVSMRIKQRHLLKGSWLME